MVSEISFNFKYFHEKREDPISDAVKPIKSIKKLNFFVKSVQSGNFHLNKLSGRLCRWPILRENLLSGFFLQT